MWASRKHSATPEMFDFLGASQVELGLVGAIKRADRYLGVYMGYRCSEYLGPGIGAWRLVLCRELQYSTEYRIHVIRKQVPRLRTASDKASVASQASLLPHQTIRSTGKGAIAHLSKPALHAVSPHSLCASAPMRDHTLLGE